MKVNTIEQFKIMDYLKKNLDLTEMSVVLKDRVTVTVTDHVGDSVTFRWENNKVVWE